MIKAFFTGIREFRTDLTTHYGDNRRDTAYDHGREWAHRLTFRQFDQTR